MTLKQTTRTLQRELKEVGYDPGPLDGIWGTRTARAALMFVQGGAPEPAPTGEEFDRRTEKNIATLEPKARSKFVPFLRRAVAVAASMGVEAKVICGRRDKAAQEKAKADGASKAGYGYSWHNFGTAIDLGLFKGRSYLDSNNPSKAYAVYKAIGALAEEFGIEWGGNWRSFKDTPHFHIDFGRSTPNSEDRRLLISGQWKF